MSERRQRCRHCPRRPKYLRPRGLCNLCYADPKIRRRYPTRRNQNSGAERAPDVNGVRPVPRRRTRAVPGTSEKVAALMLRAARKQSLWHPADGQVADGEGLAVETSGGQGHVKVVGAVRLQGRPRLPEPVQTLAPRTA